jgi:very-short-patch-repair endonuclease
MSLPEILMWRELRKRPAGYRFRRQFPVEPYTLDFACLESRLAIEVDGEAHNRADEPQRDERRDADLASRGFRTLRIPARDVFADLDNVIRAIVFACNAGHPMHRPSDSTPSRSGAKFTDFQP